MSVIVNHRNMPGHAGDSARAAMRWVQVISLCLAGLLFFGSRYLEPVLSSRVPEFAAPDTGALASAIEKLGEAPKARASDPAPTEAPQQTTANPPDEPPKMTPPGEEAPAPSEGNPVQKQETQEAV
jgi:hypothetical protein